VTSVKSIDVHTHVLPPVIPRWADRFGAQGFIQLEPIANPTGGLPCRARMVRDDGTFFREIEANCWDPAIRLEESARHGVGAQVLSTVPVMFNYRIPAAQNLEIARFLNDHLAGLVAANPRRFVGLGTLPMQDPELACRELARCRSIGLRGVQLGSHVNAWNLDAPELFPVFALAEKLGVPVFIHPWDMLAPERMPRYWLPWLVGMPTECTLAICSMIFGGVLDRLPKLRVCFAHGGGSFIGTLGRIEHGFEARPDLVAVNGAKKPSDYLSRIFVDALVHDEHALRHLIDRLGADRVAMGSDYPFPLGEASPGALIKKMRLPSHSEEQLLQGTALRWLGMQKHEFDL
jgi:aminocarboxymuconate-semialdehyde decarboxylase